MAAIRLARFSATSIPTGNRRTAARNVFAIDDLPQVAIKVKHGVAIRTTIPLALQLSLDGLAEILRRAKRDLFARLNGDRFARGGVSSRTLRPFPHLERSKPGDADVRAFLEMFERRLRW